MASRVTRVEVVGPLERYQRSFEASLAGLGYTPLSSANLLGVMRHLSVWLEERGLDSADLDPDMVRAYLAARKAEGYTCWLSPKGLAPLLDHLRDLGVAPMPVSMAPAGPVEELLARYQRYLATERGLVPKSLQRYLHWARSFLIRWVDGTDLRLDHIGGAEVTAFVVAGTSRRGVGDAKYLVTVVRSLLRFLVLDGVITVDLSGAVPSVAGWRGSHLPRGLSPAQVAALLESCDRGHPKGRRDLAVLTLLARLGLRACEVARLRLDDFDWRHGELIIRGKGRRDERLPLPHDVGEVIVNYLQAENNRGKARELFVGARAPFAPLTARGVTSVVRHAAARAGLGQIQAHRLRHSAATQMLLAGTPLTEVGQVLRHRTISTTAIYAKVDRIALGDLALAWPEVAA